VSSFVVLSEMWPSW